MLQKWILGCKLPPSRTSRSLLVISVAEVMRLILGTPDVFAATEGGGELARVKQGFRTDLGIMGRQGSVLRMGSLG